MSEHLAVIAGAGRFPFNLVQEARRQGLRVSVVGLTGWVDPNLKDCADTYTELSVGSLGQLIHYLVDNKISRAIMAGKVTKAVLLDSSVEFDAETLAILSRLEENSVTGILGAIGARLAEAGVQLLDSSTFMQSALCPEGSIAKRSPTAHEQADIQFGLEVAQQMAKLDVGQTVVVSNRVVVAVEALEGTDACIRRAGQLTEGALVVVKMAAPSQDRRFDLPCIGPETVRTLKEAGVSCLAVQAGSTILLDRELLLKDLEASGIALVGVNCEPAS